MRAVAAGLSDVGRERIHNEDRYILLPEFNVFVVADGMGGHEAGEVASRIAASAIAGYFREANGKRRKAPTGDRLRAAVTHANARIFAYADDSRFYRGMGTTVVAAAFSPRERKLYVAHAGDSRCYLLRRGGFAQLTRDHSLIAEALLERPDLTERDLAYLPRNVITRALGIGPSVDVDLRAERVEAGDVFLLCSDGLHGLVDDREIARIIEDNAVLAEACGKLIDCANENGGRDNITAVLIRIEETAAASWSQRQGARGRSAR
ncbi:Stp1/IreP family PP2C-type Ser/Thr phosphatase [Sorangium sp. So ce1036]|uniref:Stp1/IreP family PP2C-type Ser/Thr phosphatase n=1 Tax=Sorangium sp. So ce1036 TaxID=3133328 RepID=UPI003EFBE830